MNVEEIKSSGSSSVESLLYGPAYLAAEIVGNAFPGLLLILLISFKQPHLVSSLFQLSYIGYRTKLLLVVFLAFLAGKLLGIPLSMVQSGVLPGTSAIQVEKTKYSPDQQLLLNVLLGAVVMPTFIGKTRIADNLVFANAGVYLSVSSGIALLISLTIPGDANRFKLIELGAALLFLLAGYYQAKHFLTSMQAYVGLALKEFVKDFSAKDIAALMPLLTMIYGAATKSQAKVEQSTTSSSTESPPPSAPAS